MKRKDDLEKLLNALKKREEILINDEPMWKYNRYFDRMRVYAHKLIDENRQEEVLPYLYCDSLSIQCDIAGLLFHCYPEECEAVLIKLSKMTIKTGLPIHFSNISTSAKMTLIHGIPKDFP